MDNRTLEFLEQSNYIEGVRDSDSLDQAVRAWEYCIDQNYMSLSVMLKTHKILMLNQPLRPNEKGYFRKIDVYIGGRKALHYARIKPALNTLCLKMNTFRGMPKGVKADHVEYERIHPFVDGNGRTGRIFMNWYLKRFHNELWIIREEDRFNYYNWFNKLS